MKPACGVLSDWRFIEKDDADRPPLGVVYVFTFQLLLCFPVCAGIGRDRAAKGHFALCPLS